MLDLSAGRGSCKCAKCDCIAGYSGKRCECQMDTSSCIEPNSQVRASATLQICTSYCILYSTVQYSLWVLKSLSRLLYGYIQSLNSLYTVIYSLYTGYIQSHTRLVYSYSVHYITVRVLVHTDSRGILSLCRKSVPDMGSANVESASAIQCITATCANNARFETHRSFSNYSYCFA